MKDSSEKMSQLLGADILLEVGKKASEITVGDVKLFDQYFKDQDWWKEITKSTEKNIK